MALSSVILALAGSAQATTFNFNSGDLLICFRQTGGGTYDLVVDAGPVTTFTNLAVGQNITISPTYYTSTQLAKLGINNISWTAFAYFTTNVANGLTNTVFMSDPWPDAVTQPDPWTRAPAVNNAGLISYLSTVGNTAAAYVNTTNASTATASLVPENISTPPFNSYLSALGANLDFHGYFQADPEQSTGPTFTTGATPTRADFYELAPYAGFPGPNGVFWGFFELATNGVMTYTAGPPSLTVTPPTIVSIIHSGTTNTITFTTGLSGTYTLLGASNLTVPRASWTVLGSIPGNGSPQSLTHVTAGPAMFYLISGQ